MNAKQNLLLAFHVLLAMFFSHIACSQPAIEWKECYGGSADEHGREIRASNDGGYLLLGYTSSFDGDVVGNHGAFDLWLVKVDSIGTFEWQSCYGGSGFDWGQSLQETGDNGIIMCGSISGTFACNSNSGFDDGWMVKLDDTDSTDWNICFGGSQNEGLESVRQTPDGGYIATGYVNSTNGNVNCNHSFYTTDLMVVKVNAAGVTQWYKCLGGSSGEYGYHIELTTDGGYILAGQASSFDGDVVGMHNNGDAWVVKLDSTGNIDWQKCLGGTKYDEGWCVQQTSDDGYIVAGTARSTNGDVSGNHGITGDFWVVKLEAGGNIEWQKCLGGSEEDAAYTIIETNQGGYVVAGEAYSNDGDVEGNHGNYDVWVVGLDDFGDIEWKKTMGGSNHDYAQSILQTSDGGFLVFGASESLDGDVFDNYGAYDLWLIKLEAIPVGITWIPETSFSIYPTLAQDKVTVKATEFYNGYSLVVNTLSGSSVAMKPITSERTELDVSQFHSGIYFFKIVKDGLPYTVQKVVVAEK